ncbi:MAG: hypothetical protein KBE23_09765 [Chloroflexi bacterium]|nr:hypothetical protein [Chloroflexota bacterium]MBP7043019.1 hypothetical protein [Chloroflexota bacterium]
MYILHHKLKDLPLQEYSVLYDNIAFSGDCRGRLRVELRISPFPVMDWEFEILERDVPHFQTDSNHKVVEPVNGIEFSIGRPSYALPSFSTYETLSIQYRGRISRAFIGNQDLVSKSFSFYLPNAKFHEIVLPRRDQEEQRQVNRELRITEGGRELGVERDGRWIETKIDDEWSVRIFTRDESLKWLGRTNREQGTKITTSGRLYQHGEDEKKKAITLEQALDTLKKLSSLLAFANGGYTGPLYVEGVGVAPNRSFSGVVTTFEVTPIELMGETWLDRTSSLGNYIRCFPSFCKMVNTSPWNQVYQLALIWYFQAIQPMSPQSAGKPWPVIANALGAALETLSYTILVLEEDDLEIRNTNKKLFDLSWDKVLKKPSSHSRLIKLLERIGISKSPGFSVPNSVKDFVLLRNEATHQKPGGERPSSEMRDQVIRQAIQWLEECLLWRLGYSGEYLDRSTGSSINPRYDLGTRNSSW